MAGKKLKVITAGDQTTSGGTVQNGALTVFCQGRAVALIGSTSFCPQCKTHGIIRQTKPFNVFAENKQICLEGDVVECGCPIGTNRLIASPGAFEFIGNDDGTVSYRLAASATNLPCNEQFLQSGLYDSASSPVPVNEPEIAFMLQFHCLDDEGVPLSCQHYSIHFSDGIAESGITDESGMTGWYTNETAQNVTLHIG